MFLLFLLGFEPPHGQLSFTGYFPFHLQIDPSSHSHSPLSLSVHLSIL